MYQAKNLLFMADTCPPTTSSLRGRIHSRGVKRRMQRTRRARQLPSTSTPSFHTLHSATCCKDSPQACSAPQQKGNLTISVQRLAQDTSATMSRSDPLASGEATRPHRSMAKNAPGKTTDTLRGKLSPKPSSTAIPGQVAHSSTIRQGGMIRARLPCMPIKSAHLDMEQDRGKRRVKVQELADWTQTLGIRVEGDYPLVTE